MAINVDATFSRGDVMRRLADIERQVQSLQTARRLEAASIGAGGLRIQGGRLLAEDASGSDVFEVTTEPPSIVMRPELISELAAQVFADRVYADFLDPSGGETLPAGSGYTDLTTVGPTLTNVEVSETGRMLVFNGSHIGVHVSQFTSAFDTGGGMSYEIDGPVNRPAGDLSTAASIGMLTNGAALPANFVLWMFSKCMNVSLQEGLPAGTYTVTAKYGNAASDADTVFTERIMAAIAF